jgi:hypothetical protein
MVPRPQERTGPLKRGNGETGSEIFLQKAENISAKNPINVLLGVAPVSKISGYRPDIGDAVEVQRRLLRPKTSVQIGSDAYVICCACELTDVIDVFADF